MWAAIRGLKEEHEGKGGDSVFWLERHAKERGDFWNLGHEWGGPTPALSLSWKPSQPTALVIDKILAFFSNGSHTSCHILNINLKTGLSGDWGLIVWTCYVTDLIMIYHFSQSNILFRSDILHVIYCVNKWGDGFNETYGMVLIDGSHR